MITRVVSFVDHVRFTPDEILQLVDINDIPSSVLFANGQRVKVRLAMCLVSEPPLLPWTARRCPRFALVISSESAYCLLLLL